MVDEAREIISALPADRAGTCVLTETAELLRAPAANLNALLAANRVLFHGGSICGAFPILVR